eukprot:m.89418 g.89418  ORF g.89418 m.89418 type:complete len:201 (+) comp13658_c0_seq4:96-698(+)
MALHAWILRAVLLVILLLGDHVQFSHRLGNALLDNGTHASAAALQWLLMTHHSPALREHANIFTFVLAACMGSFIDLDHFLAAHSLSLKDAVSLPSRPPFHATLALLAVLAVVFALTRLHPPLRTWGWLPLMAAAALLSHHLRDGYRRGLWLWPLPYSLPLTYPAYLVLEMLLAPALALLSGPRALAAPARMPMLPVRSV